MNRSLGTEHWVTWLAGSYAIVAITIAASAPAGAAGLFRCTDASGQGMYSTQPCPDGKRAVVPIDSTTPTDSTLPGPKSLEPGSAGRVPKRGSIRGPAVTDHPAQEPQPISASDEQRIAQLRERVGATEEARIATEIAIAAIREGADAKLSAADRRTLESLRGRLVDPDPQARAEALRAWQSLYARYRPRVHPRVPLPPEPLGGSARPRLPEPPLGAVAPGSQGPLVGTPSAPSGANAARPGGPVADPATGQVLAPTGDRLVDPITGRIWMRSGPNYVDPTTGRVIPAR